MNFNDLSELIDFNAGYLMFSSFGLGWGWWHIHALCTFACKKKKKNYCLYFGDFIVNNFILHV